MSADPIIFPVPDANVRDPKQLNTVWFEWKDEKDEAASAAAGHPVFDSVVLAHVMGPGLQRSEAVKVVVRKKPDGTITEHPGDLKAQLEAFLKGDPGNLAGTPLSELTILDSGLIATLKAMNVHSIEALAGMSETAAPGLMGFRKFKTAAQAYIEQRDGQAPLNKLAAENESLRDQIELLQRQFDELAARIPADDAGKGKRKAA